MTAAHDPDVETTSTVAISTPVGRLLITGDDASIVRVAWSNEDAQSDLSSAKPVVAEAVRQLHAYFDGSLTTFDLPIELSGVSASARAVLTALHRDVPSGTTVTYGQLATMSGTGIPARSVGSIMGVNPTPLLIPCHRVVAGDGLGGFSGGLPGEGLATKRWLLEFEGALPPTLF